MDGGGRVIQETRHFHEDTGTTTSGRSKEEAQDYRYFPEPDLVPVAPPRDWVEQIRASLPEAPAKVRARLRTEWNVSALEMDAIVNAGALVASAALLTAFGVDSKMTANAWIRRSSSSVNLTETISCNLASPLPAGGAEPRLVADRVVGLVLTDRLSP